MRDVIKNDRLYLRVKDPRHIIIVPAFNFTVKSTVYKYDIIRSSYKYSWGKFQEYFYERLQMLNPPMHYFVELIDDDYAFLTGIGITSRSLFISELIKAKAINSQYDNAIVVAINEDYRVDSPEKRLLQGVSNFIITPLMRQFKISKENVLFIDDILDPDALALVHNTKDDLRKFNLEKSKYWDHNQLQFIIKEFLKR